MMTTKLWCLVFSLFYIFVLEVEAGTVRSIEMSDHKMEPIYLSLGKSTILRFRELPKKMVVGNKNYFNLEFIGNDVTIQPLNSVTSNLFIYTDYRVYGFILKSSDLMNYDDLVNVRWKSPFARRLTSKTTPKKQQRAHESFSFKVGKGLEITAEVPFPSPVGKGAYILDLIVTNNSKEVIKSKSIKITLTYKNASLKHQKLIFEADEINEGQRVKARILLQLEESQGITVNAEFKGRQGKVIIPRRAYN